uniref:Uncharacterized protein n=1 Tax=Oryza brachyantha TaxID=4533 RepID=J3N1T9_ORYBR
MAVTVEITKSEVIRPSPASCGDAGGARSSPLTVFDRAAMDMYIPSVYAWRNAGGGAEAVAEAPPSNRAIKLGLAAVLPRFPHLAGRFDVDARGRRCFDLNDAGVFVFEAAASGTLADALAHDVAAHVNELYPKADTERADEPLVQVQLTRYTCGGLVIGATAHHHIADGHAERGGRNSRATLPLDRIQNLAVHFPDEFVARLKAQVGVRCSTFRCLLAHAWKKITAARGLPPEAFTQVRVAVDCRGRTTPPVPRDYFGNMVLWAFPRMQVGQLLSASYAAVAGVISDAVARVDERYIRSFVDFGEATGEEEELAATAAEPGTVLCPDLEVDSWLGFRFHELDFGGGPPCAFLTPDVPIEGIFIFVPSCAGKGGIEMFVALQDTHVEAFREICYSLD